MKSIGIQYNAKLQKLARQAKRDVDQTITPLVRSYAPEYTADAWSDGIQAAIDALLARWSSERVRMVAARMAGEFVQVSLSRAERGMKRSAGIDVFSGSQQMQDHLKAATQQNANLIMSIPNQYIERVGTTVLANMRSGMRPGFIEKALQDEFGVTQNRARMIARDQTAKVQGELAEKQQTGAGFSFFKWQDSSDERVRHRHEEIANKVTAYGPGVYSWSNLPLSDKGLPIKPGSDYQCRCTAIPVSDREVEAYRKNGKTAPGVYR